MKNSIKKLRFYQELRYLYRVFFHYRRPLSYAYYRFFLGPKIRTLEHPLDQASFDPSYSIHFLCSHTDLDMLLWSLASWYQVVLQSGRVYIHEDGSFSEEDRKIVAKLFPQAEIIDYEWATTQALEIWLKNSPYARSFRQNQKVVFATKLVDPYFVSPASARLLLDTDVLWFRTPTEILDLLHKQTHPFFLAGRVPMNFVFADNKFPADIATLNAGIIGYAKQDYQLADLEEFCQKIGPQSDLYFFEQAGHAYVLSRHNRIQALDKQTYFIRGRVDQNTVVKHYTRPRREEYWFEGIRILKQRILS
jgi:hypothetical protein